MSRALSSKQTSMLLGYYHDICKPQLKKYLISMPKLSRSNKGKADKGLMRNFSDLMKTKFILIEKHYQQLIQNMDEMYKNEKNFNFLYDHDINTYLYQQFNTLLNVSIEQYKQKIQEVA